MEEWVSFKMHSVTKYMEDRLYLVQNKNMAISSVAWNIFFSLCLLNRDELAALEECMQLGDNDTFLSRFFFPLKD